MLTIGSLFSGIGGLELGLEWAGLGPVIWQVERDPFCRRVLARHWPGVPRYADIKQATRTNLDVPGVLVGGFPCQDVSSAGNRAGLAGKRSGLWSEFRRLAAELGPEWIVVENVASGAGLWVDRVCADLAELGYATLPIPLSAVGVGLPHRRRRIFIVAYTHGEQLRDQRQRVSRGWPRTVRASGHPEPRDDGTRGAATNADKQPRILAHAQGETERNGREGARPHAIRDGGRMGAAAPDPDGQRQPPGGDGRQTLPPGGAQFVRAPRWPTEPPICRATDGVSDRVDRLRVLGNSVVPQCAEIVGYVIKELDGCNEDNATQ
jgi:DNA (cytosine-5)-methyltransferase 1